MDDKQSSHLDSSTRYGLITLALVQGYALYFLHLSITEEAWPATDMRWLKAFYTLVIGLPAFFYLGMERFKDKRNAVTAVVLGTVLFVLGWHLGWTESVQGVSPSEKHRFTPPFVISLGVALFILAFFYRSWSITGRLRFHYSRLLAFSWEQALTLGLLGLFIGVFWLLLQLWAGLFNAIGVSFFKELFRQPPFVYPVTWLVLGLGLVLIRNRIRLVATVQFMCEALIKALLPLAAFMIVLFLAALPFTGLKPVWDTGSAAFLMMALTLILLFFFNAVLSGSTDTPQYPYPLRVSVLTAVALLPICTLVAAWALWLRIAQYGLTPDRIWAFVVLLLIAGYTFSYSALILWKRTDSIRYIQTANKGLALVIAGVLILVNTPLADPRAWAAQSQASRLLSGDVSVEEFDYAYMRFSLGAHGVRALREIEASEFAEENPEVSQYIAAAMKQENRYSKAPLVDRNDLAAVANVLDVTPAGEVIPEPLLKLIAENQLTCTTRSDHCEALKLTGTDDGADWLVFQGPRHCAYGSAYTMHNGQWVVMGQVNSLGCCHENNAVVSERIPGPFLAYTKDGCIYSVQADERYLRRLVE